MSSFSCRSVLPLQELLLLAVVLPSGFLWEVGDVSIYV